MEPKIKLACCTLQYMLEGISLPDAVKSIAGLGFEAVELTFGEDYAGPDDEFPDVAK